MLQSHYLCLLLIFGPCLWSSEGATEKHDCVDTADKCEFWASKHECVANPFYMRRYCEKVGCVECFVTGFRERDQTYSEVMMAAVKLKPPPVVGATSVLCAQACDACRHHLPSKQAGSQNRVPGYATEKWTRQYAMMLPSISRHAAPGHFRKDTSMGTYFTPGAPHLGRKHSLSGPCASALSERLQSVSNVRTAAE